MGARRADRIGIALGELAEAPRPRLLVAPDRAEGIAAERLGEGLPVLGGKARERGGEIIAQGDPLLIVVGEGEDALIRAVRVGQELAERVDIFKGAGIEGFKAPARIDLGHAGDDLGFGAQQRLSPVGEAARLAGEVLAGLRRVGHGIGLYSTWGTA